MKNTVIINGVEYVPRAEPVKVKPTKAGRWKPEMDEMYSYIDGNDGAIMQNAWYEEGNYYCHFRWKYGNCYQTEALAIRARDRQLLLVEVQDYADQKNAGEELSSLCYILVKYNNKWDWSNSATLTPGTIKFRKRADVEDAITHFGDRLDLLL